MKDVKVWCLVLVVVTLSETADLTTTPVPGVRHAVKPDRQWVNEAPVVVEEAGYAAHFRKNSGKISAKRNIGKFPPCLRAPLLNFR